MSEIHHLDVPALSRSVAEFAGDAAAVLGVSEDDAVAMMQPMVDGGMDLFSAAASAILAPLPGQTAAIAAALDAHAAHVVAATHGTISILSTTDEDNAARIARTLIT